VEGATLSLQVTDNGIGLPREEARERLTEPYVTHKPKGTGLGLAIVKKIMEDHGGSISLEDRPEGPGTRAVLVLPLGESPWQSDEPAAKAAQAAN
jgi:two-component system nitrogen regulation sensor histidine kinase NtrY